MNIPYYRRMLADSVRVRAFRRAIRATVRPGDVVVDIGAGLGTYSMFAAQAGARRVYAIESDPEICRLAECLADQNGLGEKIQYLRGYSTDIELPERADVAIFEDYTSFFFSTGLRVLLADIRDRLLKRAGRLIPGGVDLFVAGAEDPRIYREIDLLKSRRDHLFGLDFVETRRLVMNQPLGVQTSARSLMTSPLRCARFDLKQAGEFEFACAGRRRIRRDGRLHGILGWMELILARGVRLSCSPARPRTVWGQDLFPFAEPLRVRRGQAALLGMEMIFPKGLSHFVQRWSVLAGGDHREGNSFAGAAYSEKSLTSESAGTRGKLGPRSRALLTILSELGGETSYGGVAAALVKKHPRLFESREDALTTVIRAVPALSSLAGGI